MARCQPGLNCRCALHLHVLEPLPQLVELAQRLGDLVGLADDADQAVHRVLQIELQRVRVLRRVTVASGRRTAPAPAWRPRSTASSDTCRPFGERADVVGGAQPGAPAEHQQVRQRVAAEPVGAVHAARALARGEQPGCVGRAGVGIDLDAAHHVVAGRPDFHRLLGDVDLGQLHELVVHRRQPALDLLGGQPRRDVEEDAAVRRVTARPSPRS